MRVSEVINEDEAVINENITAQEVREWLSANKSNENYFIVVNDQSEYKGSIKLSDIYNTAVDGNQLLKDLVTTQAGIAIKSADTLRQAIAKMSKAGAEVLPVLSNDNKVIGVLSYKDIINAYTQNIERNESAHVKISLKRRGIKMRIKGKRIN